MCDLEKLPWAWWERGEPEDDLHGFVSKQERDDHDGGKPGPFRRIIRNHHELGPLPIEARVLRAYLDGNLSRLK